MSYSAAIIKRALETGAGWRNPALQPAPQKSKSKAVKVLCTCGCRKSVKKPGSGPHKYRVECKACGKFVRWASQ